MVGVPSHIASARCRPETLAAVQRHQAVRRAATSAIWSARDSAASQTTMSVPAVGGGENALVAAPTADRPFIVLTTAPGPRRERTRGGTPRSTPTGFLRSVTLRWSNTARNTNRSPASASGGEARPCARSTATGSATGIGTCRTGTGDTAANASVDEPRAGPDLVDQRDRLAHVLRDVLELPEPVADHPPRRGEQLGVVAGEQRELIGGDDASDVANATRLSTEPAVSAGLADRCDATVLCATPAWRGPRRGGGRRRRGSTRA